MLSSRQSYFFLALLILALCIRIAAAIAIDRHVTAEGRQFLIEGDANGYWELGQKIAAGQEYSIYTPPRRVLRTPGFPLLLAASIRLFGNSIFAASLVMAVVGAACCGLTAVLARQLTDNRTALWALALVAISPIQVGSNVQILSETWFSFWLLLSLVAAAALFSDRPTGSGSGGRDLRQSLISGIATGLTVLVRPGWILWPWLSSLIVLTCGRQAFARRLLMCGLIFAGCYLALLPWAWRNHTVTGHWIFTSLWSGPSLYDGLHPGATGASDMTFVDQESVYTTMSEFDANAHYKQRALEFAAANPVRTAALAFHKAARYLSPTLNASGFSGGLSSVFCLLWYAGFWGLVAIGSLDLRKSRAALMLLTGPFLQFLLVHMVFVGSIRYRLPVEFPLSIIAAKGLDFLQRKYRSDKADSQLMR